MEIKVTIEATAIAEAINNLATAIARKGTVNQAVENVPANTPTKIPDSTNESGIVINNSPTTAVPLAAAPKFTIEQIMAAGATLMDAGKVNELIDLLHSFGVQAVMDLKPEQLGAFATKMREMGAKI